MNLSVSAARVLCAVSVLLSSTTFAKEKMTLDELVGEWHCSAQTLSGSSIDGVDFDQQYTASMTANGRSLMQNKDRVSIKTSDQTVPVTLEYSSEAQIRVVGDKLYSIPTAFHMISASLPEGFKADDKNPLGKADQLMSRIFKNDVNNAIRNKTERALDVTSFTTSHFSGSVDKTRVDCQRVK